MALTPKQRRFVSEYLVDQNGTQAAIRAGYQPIGAAVQASRLLTNPKIAQQIDARLGKFEIRADRILQELARIGLADPRQLFDPDGQLRPIHDLSEDAARTIASVEVLREKVTRGEEVTTEETLHKVKTWDKTRALEILAKCKGMMKERHEHTGADGADLFGAASDRLARFLVDVATARDTSALPPGAG